MTNIVHICNVVQNPARPENQGTKTSPYTCPKCGTVCKSG